MGSYDQVVVNMSTMNQSVIEQFRSGAPMRMPKDRMLLLTTVGRRSGRAHTTPMMFVRASDEAGNHIVVTGSNSGSITEPDWVRNIRNDSSVKVEIGDGSTGHGQVAAQAEVVDAVTRRRWWPRVTAAVPMWGGAPGWARPTDPARRHTPRPAGMTAAVASQVMTGLR